MQANPISFADILAYCVLLEVSLSPEEVKVIKLLDNWLLDFSAKEQEKKLNKQK